MTWTYRKVMKMKMNLQDYNQKKCETTSIFSDYIYLLLCILLFRTRSIESVKKFKSTQSVFSIYFETFLVQYNSF